QGPTPSRSYLTSAVDAQQARWQKTQRLCCSSPRLRLLRRARAFWSSPQKQPSQSPRLRLQFRPVRRNLPETPRKKLQSTNYRNYEEKRFKLSEPLGTILSSAVSGQLSFVSFEVDILLKAVGDTPIMKTKKWAVERTRTVQALIDFIRKFLRLLASEQLFIYVNQSFAPSPDQEVGTLYECFGSDGKLVLHYCKSQAWG
uniref:Ubiquitin-like protein ATG12 n=1 Tax=Rattus norvegicus TaxID=10116 RepID=A0A8I5ZYH3_RAT